MTPDSSGRRFAEWLEWNGAFVDPNPPAEEEKEEEKPEEGEKQEEKKEEEVEEGKKGEEEEEEEDEDKNEPVDEPALPIGFGNPFKLARAAGTFFVGVVYNLLRPKVIFHYFVILC
jgi:hypothetical protein